MSKVLISGGTGSVGRLLSEFLTEEGHEVSLLSRNPGSNDKYSTFLWNPSESFLDPKALEGCEYIIHLAGAGIADKNWTSQRKKAIIESRVQSTDLLFNSVKKLQVPLKAFISASAVGYYGQINSTRIFKEEDQSANDFVGKTCFLWEQAAQRFEELKVRTVRIRIGIVLMKQGGALEKMAKPIRLGFGGVLGSGEQYIPWIHSTDLIRIFGKVLANTDMHGAFNAVAPSFNTNKDFTLKLAKVLGKKIWLPPVPSFVLKGILGERALLLLKGSRVSSEKLIESGYQFEHLELEEALHDLLAG